MDNPSPRLTSKALRYLAIRPRSQFELVQYLERKLTRQESTATIHEVINYLKTLQLIDDEKFAQEYARYLLNQGKGPIIISYQLKQKGIDELTIQTTLASIDQATLIASAHKLSVKRLKHTRGDVNASLTQIQLIHYLYSRGYSSKISRPVIDELRSVSVQ